MSKIKILFADTNETYVKPIERKLVEEFGEYAEIHIITDINYFNEFFMTPQNFDLVIIDESLYGEELSKHTIKEIYILMEDIEEVGETQRLTIHKLYKYSGVKEIIGQIIRGQVIHDNMSSVIDNNTKLITMYSPQGGAGTSTLALSLAAIAAKGLRKVLFVAIDNLQNFEWILDNNIIFPSSLEKKLSEISDFTYGEVKPAISNEGFDYLPPFRQAMSVLDIKAENMIALIEEIKKTNQYEYIVVDTSSDFNDNIPKLMAKSDKVIIVTEQDKVAAKKLKRLLLNIDTSNAAKFSVVCNKYMPDKENYIVSEELINNCRISQYVEYEAGMCESKLDVCIQNQQIQKFAYLYI